MPATTLREKCRKRLLRTRFPQGTRTSELLPLESRIPAESCRKCWLVVFALDHVLRAAVVEAKHFVIGIQNVGDESQPVAQDHTALQINLQVGIEIGVAEG